MILVSVRMRSKVLLLVVVGYKCGMLARGSHEVQIHVAEGYAYVMAKKSSSSHANG